MEMGQWVMVHGGCRLLQLHKVAELCLHQSIQLKCVISMTLYAIWVINLLTCSF